MVMINGQEVVRIRVGRSIIDDLDKGEMPVPEVPFGKPFVIEVHWVDSEGDFSTELSDFRIVTFDRESSPFWIRNREVSLTIRDERGAEVDEIVFDHTEGETTTRRISLERSIPGGVTLKPELILFKHTVKRDGKDWFIFDPPWVGKPPVG